MNLNFHRLSPAFIVVSFMMIVLPLIGSGPLWRETLEPYSEACERLWWTNPLYIGAYVKRENMVSFILGFLLLTFISQGLLEVRYLTFFFGAKERIALVPRHFRLILLRYNT